jgi:hypothetical protein
VWLAVLSLAAPLAWAQSAEITPEKPDAGASTSLRFAQDDIAGNAARQANLPPRVAQAERFLAQRGWRPGAALAGRLSRSTSAAATESRSPAEADNTGSSSASWLSLGPAAVQSQSYGLVTGRISSLALDPSDATGNTLYVGTTGGGVWRSQNAGTSLASNISFIPLMDDLPALSGATDTSISIGAVSVQPGGTGVILAGTGDPNDALDSYYGAGILRSTDGGTTWSLIPYTSDGLYSFVGEGIAGFAWSTANQQRVVAAVSQALEGTLVDAVWPGESYEGLYYSSDGGATWALATVTDGATGNVQSPGQSMTYPDGNAATAVVWNPVRQLFIAAVRYHGYYQSADGITWTRMTNQPGVSLTTTACPTYPGQIGSNVCPIFRGALAVNPMTGDTFAWSVDLYNQDQGIWQDQCAVSAGVCANQTMTFAKQWGTAALERKVPLQGTTTIVNGDYNLALAAVPSQQDTLLMAGANDLWKCSLAAGCVWRNTTNSTVGFCAEVGEYQHAVAWNASNPLEIFVGNDSGLWRSTDAIGVSTTSSCAASDATHFQNLNGSLGSLAEPESISPTGATPYTMMAGLGTNGTAGVNSSSGPAAEWPEILGGEGGPVAVDPQNSAKWYVNNGAGVSIYLGSPPTTGGTPSAFNAVLNYATAPTADVVKDGYTMSAPAPFLVDPLDDTKLLIGTCRVWRGPASGVGWSDANAISAILDGQTGNANCDGDALIRSLAAQTLPVTVALPSGGEVVYVGMYGTANGGEGLPGHVLSATYNAATSSWSAWTDLSFNPVSNDTYAMNRYGLDISSIVIDAHDPTGKTVYVTVAGIPTPSEKVQTVYRSTDGGAHWTALTSNLPQTPANGLAVDPQDANTIYAATDAGVYSTRQIANCATSSSCWAALGSGLPAAPVVAVSAAPATATVHDLVAATYGRGIWMTPLWTASESYTTATATPASLTFASQVYGSSSSAQTVTLKNTGTLALTPSYLSVSGDFSESDSCAGSTVQPNASCTIQVTFTPTQTGSRTGVLTIYANVTGGELTVLLNGTGAPSGVVSLTPASINFGGWQVGTTSTALQVTAANSGSPAISFTSSISGAFAIATNACGTSVPATGSCNLTLTFSPTQTGAATGTLSFTDTLGTQSVALSGTGLAAPTDTLSTTSLIFSGTVIGQLSTAQTVTLTNSGGVALSSISISVSGAFQQTNPCTVNLAANSSCAISVQYNPTAAGTQTGTLTISDALHTQTVTLSGTGLTPPALGVNSSSLTFTAQVGVASAPQTLTVTNTGGAPLSNVGFQISGLSAASFSTGTTTCGATLASGGSCTVQVIFTPSATGGSTAQLAVSSSTSGVAPVTVQLSGTGQSTAGISVNPTQLAFPIVSPGLSSPVQTVSLTNTGGSAATSLTLTATAPFSLTLNTCGATLAAGASCSTGVQFTPQVNGSYTGTLTISSPSLTAAATVPLSGTGGVPGSVHTLPSLIAFQQTGVGEVSSPITVTITNPSGTASLTSFALAASTGYQLVNNTCPSTLAAQASCTVGVEFAPLSAGVQSGNLIISSSALTTGSFVPLSGTGFDFTFVPTGSTAVTIANGQKAYYTLTLKPLNGSRGAFTFQCGSLPPYSSCTFNPTSEAISPNSTGSVVVAIATGLTTTASVSRRSAWPALPLACGLALLPLALTKRRRALLLMALLAVLAGGFTSCTNSTAGIPAPPTSSGPGITAAATYTIPVTATSNGVSHSVTVTLTVD